MQWGMLVTVVGLTLCLRAFAAGQTPADPHLVRTWRAFQQAVAHGQREQVAAMTFFPFTHPARAVSRTGKVSRAEFLAKYDRIFTAGIRKQIALGSPRPVTAKDIQEAKDEDLDPCGTLGDIVVFLPPDAPIDLQRDDETFLHVVFRKMAGKYVLHRVIGCN
jgi:hypothetical protein